MFVPVAAGVSGLFIVAVPAIVFMVIWTVVTVMRVLYPERPLPFDAAARREAARRRGEEVRVGARDIEEDLRRRPARPALPRREAVPRGADGAEPWREDLWRRRN